MKIICVGKIKEQYLKDAIQEYLKRLSKYTKVEVVELLDASFQDASKNREVEGEKILSQIKDKDYVITLEINGKEFDSLQFASKNQTLFVIGGSNGLSEAVKQRSNEAISFSKMTFPHQLFRILLLEQIYRSYKIRHHEAYHK